MSDPEKTLPPCRQEREKLLPWAILVATLMLIVFSIYVSHKWF